MRSIISIFINISLIFSILFLTTKVEAQDFVNGQIDYAMNLKGEEALAFLVPDTEKERKPIAFKKEVSVCLIPSLPAVNPTKATAKITPPKTRQMMRRESITFILGKDTNVEIPFYEEAFYYFANHPYDRTEYIITSCQSLLEVRNFLASFPTENALPWSTINIVLSPIESEDLRVPIFPQGTKSNIENLEMVRMENDFPSLTSNQIDQWTTLYIHGAEVEKDSKLNYALSGLLFSKESMAIQPVFLNDSFVVEIVK